MDACRAWELPSALFHGDASGWKELADNSGHTAVAILSTLLEHTPLDNECIGDILNWMEWCHSVALLVILSRTAHQHEARSFDEFGCSTAAFLEYVVQWSTLETLPSETDDLFECNIAQGSPNGFITFAGEYGRVNCRLR